MKNRVLVLQHVDCEGLGYFNQPLTDAGINLEVVKIYNGKEIPESSSCDALIVLGGYMNVYEENKYPFLKGEDDLIRHALSTGLPFLGVCLGAQLLAKALDSRVYPNKFKEIGFYDLQLTAAGAKDALFNNVNSNLEVFQWHGDTFDLPTSSELLATSKLCANQAFRYQNAYGLQFHLETTPQMINQWSKLYEDELKAFDSSLSINPLQALKAKPLAVTIINNFIKLIASLH